ncbi:hypothetical protein Tco_0125808 [Tanacetum coccineum]
MCKEYGGEQSLDLLWAFLNLGHGGDWLTLSNRGGACIPKALTKPYDVIREREFEKDKAYAELERKCNEALQDRDDLGCSFKGLILGVVVLL